SPFHATARGVRGAASAWRSKQSRSESVENDELRLELDQILLRSGERRLDAIDESIVMKELELARRLSGRELVDDHLHAGACMRFIERHLRCDHPLLIDEVRRRRCRAPCDEPLPRVDARELPVRVYDPIAADRQWSRRRSIVVAITRHRLLDG